MSCLGFMYIIWIAFSFFYQGTNQLYLADSSGKVFQKIKYDSPDQYAPTFVHNTYFLSDPVLIGDNLLVKIHFHGHIARITNEEISEKKLVYAINLTSGSTKFLGLKYPQDYLLQGPKYVEPSFAYANGKFVISYFGDNRIYYTENFGDEMKSKSLKSKYLSEKLPNLPLEADPLELRSYSYGSPHYETIVYDPFRKVYLRFAFHKYELDAEAPMDDLRNYSGPFSIQVLDEELNLLTERAFEKSRYHPFNFFIAEEGLYLSINHPLNPENKEDELTFELIGFE